MGKEGQDEKEHNITTLSWSFSFHGGKAEVIGEGITNCCFCGKPMALIMENAEYKLWCCPPAGCGRLLLEDNKENLGGTWYYAEQNEPDTRRSL